MQFVELNDREFSEFIDSREEKSFFQTVMMKNRMAFNNLETYLLGVKEDNKIIAASFVAETGYSFLNKKVYEAYKGFVLDYRNKELVKFMTDETIKFLKKRNGLKLIIDPYITSVSRDIDANIIEGIDNRDIKEYLESLGYRYFDGGEQVKWCYCLDINNKSAEELFKDFRASARNNINRSINKYKLNVRTLNRDELKEFKEITIDTCARRGFADKSLAYYEEMYDFFKDDVTFKLCELNCDSFIETLKKETEELELKLAKLSNAPSNLKKKETIRFDIENNKKHLDKALKLKEEKGNIIPLACAMFMLYGDEVVYLFSGSYDELMKFCGQYRIQWEMIKYACDNGYKRYNFYGIQDVFNPDGKDYGVYEFKKGFGGHVEEMLGCFIYSISPLAHLYDFLKFLKRKIRKA